VIRFFQHQNLQARERTGSGNGQAHDAGTHNDQVKIDSAQDFKMCDALPPAL
jgi:hypothetical protein